ncbi:MAG: 3-oxoacyl-[acyl-carrier protein] reductase [Hyphomicrobiales bacterium]|jgi:3-oxoacyl-[acyl-carrier protein] reductase|nr:3-oxoacyl-[acyl-carrier protein] reductase [Hyphomicrobiales bacterium]
MNLLLRDKVAIVGGGSQGIGFGIAKALAGEGTKIAISARRAADLERAADDIRRSTGADVLPITADCRLADDCRRVVSTVVETFGGIDILVNNDGAPPLGPIEDFDDEIWRKALDQNLMYVVRMARAALPHIRARGAGSILNITALSAIQPMAGFGLSVASWSGVIGFAKTLSLEVAAHNITVNTICPGYIETSRLEKVFASSDQGPAAMRERLTNEVPLGRLGTVDDIASLVALLVSPRGSYITGTTIQVDGGLLRAVR